MDLPELKADEVAFAKRIPEILKENERLRKELKLYRTDSRELRVILMHADEEIDRLGRCNEQISLSHAETINHQTVEITRLRGLILSGAVVPTQGAVRYGGDYKTPGPWVCCSDIDVDFGK